MYTEKTSKAMEERKEDLVVVPQGGSTPTMVNLFDPQQFATLQRICKFFASSDLVPDMYKIAADKNNETKAIANCMIAVEMSSRMQANTLAIMQNMYIVHGKPSFSSAFLISTVNTCGRFKPLKYKFNDLGETTFNRQTLRNIECVAYTTEKGGTDVLEGAPASIKLAIDEGWYEKSGSKWQTMPKQMLMYRAAAFWVRAYAPELSMGMHTVEENEDIDDQIQPSTMEQVQMEINNEANKETIRFVEEPKKPTDKKEPVAPASNEPDFMKD